MTSQFIDTREAAIAEFKSDLRSAKRRGVEIVPAAAAAFRRNAGKMVLESARMWKGRGENDKALHCLKVARGHFIIARAYDRLGAK